MLLTIEATGPQALELGFLLHKHPARLHTFRYSFGLGHIFYPVHEEQRQQVALLLEVDPLELVRGRRGRASMNWALGQYVNDRLYAVSSLMSVFINKALHTALKGTHKERPELPLVSLPLRAELCAVVCHDGPEFLNQLFDPLGYRVSFERYPLDEQFPQWGAGVAYKLQLEATRPLSELLTHLYVLIPVLDNEKHYWVGDDEIEKLLQLGAGWLEKHPSRELITRRFLRHQHGLANAALARLVEEGSPDPDDQEEKSSEEERDLERPLGLQQQRLEAIAEELVASGGGRVLDLGCGAGDLLLRLARETSISELVGMDVSAACLESARRRLEKEHIAGPLRERIRLLHGALTYIDARLEGFDAAVLAEVIEHLDPPRLLALERCVFEFARPGLVIISTPNAEYNQLWPRLAAGSFRHRDHRFEWTRVQFQSWATALAEGFGYSVSFLGIGPAHEVHGTPTQAGVFRRCR